MVMDGSLGMADELSADILVVGGGPAGCTAAKYAALNGAEVVLIERKKQIGVPFACGEFLPESEEIKRIFPHVGEVESLFDFPKHLVSRRTDIIRLYSPRLKTYEIDFRGFTVDRDRFDQYLAIEASKAGARIITGCTFISMTADGAETSHGGIRAKIIIGADGPLSSVAKSSGLPRNEVLYPAITSQANGQFEPVAEMYFGNIAPGGYAWILPKRDGANVGVGIARRFSKSSLFEYLMNFANRKKFNLNRRPRGKFVPMGGPLRPNFNERVLIVGDAAGHVMTVNGGGIPTAMICGRIAGEVASKVVLSGESLSRYARECKKHVEKPLRTALVTKRLADLCWGNERSLEWAMRLLGRRRMARIIRCRSLIP